jgi:hypothetical protein
MLKSIETKETEEFFMTNSEISSSPTDLEGFSLLTGSRESVVGITTDYRLYDRRVGV